VSPARHATACAAAVALALSLSPVSPAAAEERPASLRGRLSRAVAERLTSSEQATERLRGYERLATSGTVQAVTQLLRALDAGGAARTARERLVIVRGLYAHRADPTVRRALARALTEGLEDRAGPTEEALDAMLRASAALGLARAGTQDAFEALGGALRTVGPAALAAEGALAAHPPDDLTLITARPGIPTESEVRVLEAIGDQRAFEPLRALVRHGAPQVAARAALTLARLGHFETVALARHWRGAQDERRWAAVHILALAADPATDTLLTELLSDGRALARAVPLAREAAGSGSIRALAKLWTPRGRYAPDLAAALGRIGTPEAIRALESHLEKPDGALAGHALARAPAREAGDALRRALAHPGPRQRVALRSAAVRALVLGDPMDEAAPVAERLLRSRDPVDRAAAATWLGAAHPEQLPTLVASSDAAVVIAAMRWLAGSRDAAEAATSRLLETPDGVLAEALALALVVPEARSRVPTRVLLRLIERGGAAAPLAALTLAERQDPAVEDDVRALLASPSALIRGQVALGLGAHPERKVVAWLEEAYRFETDPGVRRALVRAALRRPEPTRERLLGLAADLDPDPSVRAIASFGRGGLVVQTDPDPRQTLCVVLERHDDASPHLVVQLPSGEALPLVPDPDGLVLAGRFPRGLLDVQVAFGAEGDHALVRGTP
jgi:cellulose synthase operon protein C